MNSWAMPTTARVDLLSLCLSRSLSLPLHTKQNYLRCITVKIKIAPTPNLFIYILYFVRVSIKDEVFI